MEYANALAKRTHEHAHFFFNRLHSTRICAHAPHRTHKHVRNMNTFARASGFMQTRANTRK